MGSPGAGAALTALYLVSRMGSGDPWRGGGSKKMLAPSITVVVGGTALSGGRGGTGLCSGVSLISLLNDILNFLDLSTFYQWIVQGTGRSSHRSGDPRRDGEAGVQQADLPRTGDWCRAGGAFPTASFRSQLLSKYGLLGFPDRQRAGRIHSRRRSRSLRTSPMFLRRRRRSASSCSGRPSCCWSEASIFRSPR